MHWFVGQKHARFAIRRHCICTHTAPNHINTTILYTLNIFAISTCFAHFFYRRRAGFSVLIPFDALPISLSTVALRTHVFVWLLSVPLPLFFAHRCCTATIFDPLHVHTSPCKGFNFPCKSRWNAANLMVYIFLLVADQLSLSLSLFHLPSFASFFPFVRWHFFPFFCFKLVSCM